MRMRCLFQLDTRMRAGQHVDIPKHASAVCGLQIQHGIADVHHTADVGDACCFHRVKDQETITALRADNGDKLWTRSYPSSYRPQIEDSDGPRCVPVIHDGRVITFGGEARNDLVGPGYFRTDFSILKNFAIVPAPSTVAAS